MIITASTPLWERIRAIVSSISTLLGWESVAVSIVAGARCTRYFLAAQARVYLKVVHVELIVTTIQGEKLFPLPFFLSLPLLLLPSSLLLLASSFSNLR
jgi:hypothetical protein